MNAETKVGIFTLCGLAVLAAGIITLGDVRFKDFYRLQVTFASAEGLPEKGPVKIAGVEVGKIESILLDGGRARVTVRMDKAVVVYRNAKARVAVTGMIGTKYLELEQGSSDQSPLKDGDVIDGETSVSMDEIMKQVSEFFREDPGRGSLADNFKQTMANLRDITDSLNVALGQQEQKLTEIVENIHELTAHARNISVDINEIIAQHKEDVKVALAKIRSISERVDEIAARIQKGEGALGKFVSDKEMGEDVKQTVSTLRAVAKDAKQVLGRIAMIETYWDYRQRYDFEDNQYRADLGLRIVPRPGKYYFIQANNVGKKEDSKIVGNDFEKRNTITAVMGKDFGPVTIFGGAIRSSGGAGMAFRPFYKSEKWNRRVELQAEAYDFPRDTVRQGIKLDSPVYNAGARVAIVYPTLWAGAQVEDIAERKNFNANMNLTFKDEDIAYLLGLVGLAR